jgi:hypothetical protein
MLIMPSKIWYTWLTWAINCGSDEIKAISKIKSFWYWLKKYRNINITFTWLIRYVSIKLMMSYFLENSVLGQWIKGEKIKGFVIVNLFLFRHVFFLFIKICFKLR